MAEKPAARSTRDAKTVYCWTCARRGSPARIRQVIEINLEIASAAMSCEQPKAVEVRALCLIAGFERPRHGLIAERHGDRTIAAVGRRIVYQPPLKHFLRN